MKNPQRVEKDIIWVVGNPKLKIDWEIPITWLIIVIFTIAFWIWTAILIIWLYSKIF